MKSGLILCFLLLGTALIGQKDAFFANTNVFLKEYVSKGGVDYPGLEKDGKTLASLTQSIAELSYSSWSNEDQKAYLINVYNLLVIAQLLENYPVASPQNIANFFDNPYATVAGEKISLNDLEKKVLFGIEADPRFHFVLVCGAKGCPSIANFAYKPSTLEYQLESQTTLALNDPQFVRYDAVKNTLGLSKIFDWYTSDFGGKQALINYVNRYRKSAIKSDAKISYYDYDWTINKSVAMKGDASLQMDSKTEKNMASESLDSGMAVKKKVSNVRTFTPSVLLKKGQKDLTFFNTIYTQDRSRWMGQEFSGFRETFFTSLLQLTYGVSESARINVGVDLNFKSSGRSSSDSFSKVGRAFDFQNNDSTRSGLASVAFRVKVAPFKKGNFSVESSISIPTVNDPEGRSGTETETALYFLDWDRYIWWNRFFFDKSIGDFQIFTEADLLFRLRRNKEQYNALDIPASVFLSYFLNDKTTFYVMSQHVERYRISEETPEISDAITTPANYTTYGFGGKYQLTQKLNLELLFTDFYRSKNAGLGETYNIGLKYIF